MELQAVKEEIYLIDGSAYIYRAYHAITPLSNSKGVRNACSPWFYDNGQTTDPGKKSQIPGHGL